MTRKKLGPFSLAYVPRRDGRFLKRGLYGKGLWVGPYFVGMWTE